MLTIATFHTNFPRKSKVKLAGKIAGCWNKLPYLHTIPQFLYVCTMPASGVPRLPLPSPCGSSCLSHPLLCTFSNPRSISHIPAHPSHVMLYPSRSSSTPPLTPSLSPSPSSSHLSACRPGTCIFLAASPLTLIVGIWQEVPLPNDCRIQLTKATRSSEIAITKQCSSTL